MTSQSIHPVCEPVVHGATCLRAFAVERISTLLQTIDKLIAEAPLRHMQTPRGYMSVAMSNCGEFGWVADKSGYHYMCVDPLTGKPWPAMPALFTELATQAALTAGFHHFIPDACLINCYQPGTKLSLHQDKDEQDLRWPIVSVSLGLPAHFLFGGQRRTDKRIRIRLESGDVVVWGGPARLYFHGVEKLADGLDPETGRCRFNLTLRRAGKTIIQK